MYMLSNYQLLIEQILLGGSHTPTARSDSFVLYIYCTKMVIVKITISNLSNACHHSTSEPRAETSPPYRGRISVNRRHLSSPDYVEKNGQE